jgi:hypothetical protein
MMTVYTSIEDVEGVVKGFEDGTLPTSEFNHAAHLTVAVWYLSQLPIDDAVEAMRASIKAYAAAHGHGGLYHETITVFWMKVVWGYMAEAGYGRVDDGGSTTPAGSVEEVRLLGLLNEVVERFGDTRLMFEYYSRERLFSAEARAGWVAPDVKGLD